MSIKLVTISDGYESEQVPSVADPIATQVNRKALSALDLTNGYITLAPVPAAPMQSTLAWQGIDQTYGLDYIIEENRLIFQARLSTLLGLGDEMTITFQ